MNATIATLWQRTPGQSGPLPLSVDVAKIRTMNLPAEPCRSRECRGRREGGGRAESAASVVRRALPLIVLIGGLVTFFALGLDRQLSLDGLRQNQALLSDLVERHVVGAALLFVVTYALATALSVPGGAVLTIAGGTLFGLLWGTLLATIGATAGAVLVFLAARTALGDTLRRRAGPGLRRFEAGFRRNAVSYLLTLRLIPLAPFWLVNLVPALFGVSLGAYALTTVIGIIPGTLVYVAIGNGLVATLTAGGEPNLGMIVEPAILLPLFGLALLSLAPVLYRLWRGRDGRSAGI